MYWLIEIAEDGRALRHGPYATAEEQKATARAMMAGGKAMYYLDVWPDGEPHVGVVLLRDGDTKAMQKVFVRVEAAQ